MNLQTDLYSFEKFDFFSDLTIEQNKYVHDNVKVTSFKKNEIVYSEGSPAHCIYFLQDGEIRISKFNESGEEFLINIAFSGSVFGLSAITGENNRNETVKTQKSSSIFVLDKEKIKILLSLNQELNIKIFKLIESRMNHLQQRLEELTFNKSQSRVINFLISKSLNTAKENYKSVITIPSLTHDSIAKLTSTSRQLVSEVLSNLKKQGLICYDRQKIKILHFEDLLKYK